MADAILRTSLVLAAGLVMTRLLARRSAALRHAVLALTLLGAAGVIPASLVLPSWTVPLPDLGQVLRQHASAAERPAVGVTVQESLRTSRTAPPARRNTASVWAAGFAIVLFTLAAGIVRLRQIAGRGTTVADARWADAARTIAAAYRLRRGVVLLEADTPFGIATWGLRPACVLLPLGATRWTDARIHSVLSHELAHVARRDWAIQVSAHVVLAALWFNPLAWSACRQLRRESELACDAAALEQGIEPADYAGHLVALARDGRSALTSWMPALPMARSSAFERRVTAMLNPRLDRRPLTIRSAIALAATLLTVTSLVAAARPTQGTPGLLSGTVYDASGGVIPGVTLALSSHGPGQWTVSTGGGNVTVSDAQQPAAQATTDAAGRFSFPGIAPGRYVLTATLPGFRQLHEEFDLSAASDWDRIVTLQVGTLREIVSVSATRTFAAPPAGPTPIRVGGNIRVPMKVHDVKPVYPDSMRAEGRQAEVQLEATIDHDGAVSSVRVLSAQIHPDFAVAASDAVRQWRYSPTLLNGTPIDVVITVTVRFSLSD